MPGPSPVLDAAVEIDGVTYKGTYYVQGAIVHVQYGDHSKTTQIGGSPARAIAKLLLSEMVRAGRGNAS